MEKLRIFNKAKELVKAVYELIYKSENLRKDYALNDQLKRAAISIVLNIAEGYGRGPKLFRNYLRIAVGSTNETIATLQIIELVHNIRTQDLQGEYMILAKQISSFSKSFT